MTRASDLARLLGAGATINDGTTITTADNTSQLILKSTDADSSVGPVLELARDSASPADGDGIGQIKHIADNDAGEATTYSSAFTTLRDASDGAEDGQTINYVIAGGALVDHLRMGRGSAGGQSEVVINEGSADIDFRVESDDNTHAFFVEGSSGDVGIGPSTINKTLHISKSTTSTDGTVYPGLQIENTSAGSGNSYANIVLHGGNATTQFSILADGRSSNSDVYIRTDTATPLLFLTNGSTRMRIESGGGIGMNTEAIAGYRLAILTNGSAEYQAIFKSSNTSGTQYHLGFNRDTTQAGHLTSNANNQVSLNNGSDYRLKENISDMTDGIERVKQLQPKKFSFLSNPDKEIVDGFLAHEVKDLVPYSVLGEKDAVDKDGEPVMQTIDITALIPVLTGAIKELIAKVETLETNINDLQKRITALEGS